MTTATDGPLLLAAIRACPEDDLVRLAYADWLDEDGQALRAEFIRVQIALALWKDDDADRSLSVAGILRHAGLRERQQALYNRLTETDPAFGLRQCCYLFDSFLTDEALAGDPWAMMALVRRGFVECVRCPLDAWREHGPAVVRAHPVTRVELTDHEPQRHFSDWWATALPEWLARHSPRSRSANRLWPEREDAMRADSYAALAWANLPEGQR